jgi:signal transduction histidine kinase
MSNILNKLQSYVFQDASIFLLLCGLDSKIKECNYYTKQLLGFDPVNQSLESVFVDFCHEIEEGKFLREDKNERLLHITTFTGLPQSFYFRFYDLNRQYLILGRSDAYEQENMRREVLDLNNDLHRVSRQLHKQNSELEKLKALNDNFLKITSCDLEVLLGKILDDAGILKQITDNSLSSSQAQILKRIIDNAHSMQDTMRSFLDNVRQNQKKIPRKQPYIMKRRKNEQE